MNETVCKFSVGQLISHRLFKYRGVIVDVDSIFQGTDEWYEQMACSRPPKDHPWYHVVVDQASHMTYVAERNLTEDFKNLPVENPLLDNYFQVFKDSKYMTYAS
jgi:heat shock protein HspQ